MFKLKYLFRYNDSNSTFEIGVFKSKHPNPPLNFLKPVKALSYQLYLSLSIPLPPIPPIPPSPLLTLLCPLPSLSCPCLVPISSLSFTCLVPVLSLSHPCLVKPKFVKLIKRIIFIQIQKSYDILR